MSRTVYPAWAKAHEFVVVCIRFTTKGGTHFDKGCVVQITGRFGGLHVQKVDPAGNLIPGTAAKIPLYHFRKRYEDEVML